MFISVCGLLVGMKWSSGILLIWVLCLLSRVVSLLFVCLWVWVMVICVFCSGSGVG